VLTLTGIYPLCSSLLASRISCSPLPNLSPFLSGNTVVPEPPCYWNTSPTASHLPPLPCPVKLPRWHQLVCKRGALSSLLRVQYSKTLAPPNSIAPSTTRALPNSIAPTGTTRAIPNSIAPTGTTHANPNFGASRCVAVSTQSLGSGDEDSVGFHTE
jgi:hypothetical protein